MLRALTVRYTPLLREQEITEAMETPDLDIAPPDVSPPCRRGRRHAA
jgi:hypothetical protein